ncbi:MAG: hypothetical protein KY475_12075 [Planctomycetes bacterium]|nr:hypothetical protein [Planctomycetota bacterium]
MISKLTPEIKEAVANQHGGPLRIEETDGSYVLMSMEVYRELMGVGSDEELHASVQALQAGHKAHQQGRTRSFRDFLDELGRKHEVPG